MRSQFAALACLCFASLPAPVFAATNCPADSIMLLVGSGQTIVTSDPYGSYGKGASCSFVGSSSATVTYNLTDGTVFISATAAVECGAEGRISTHDTFILAGPASPSALTFTAHLTGGFDGFGSRSGQVSLSVGDAVGVSGPNSDIALLITKNVGEPFDLSMKVRAGVSGGQAFANFTLSFSDLPPGYQVVSCQGFVGSSPVPVVPISWGRIKTIYR